MSENIQHFTLSEAEGKKLIPEFRFPEFKDDGEWVEKKLGDLVSIKSGYSPSRYNFVKNGKNPFVKVEDLNNCNKYQNKSRQYSNDTANLIPKYSIIFPKRGAAIHLNKVRIISVNILIDTNLMAVVPNNKIDIEFLYYFIVEIGLYKIADTSSIPQINNKHIQPYIIQLPNKQEQQKIAACLSSLDELIEARKQKLELLKQHKKGLMQNLFPITNETITNYESSILNKKKNVPKLRFPEFKDDGEWVEKKLGELATRVLKKNKNGLIKTVFTNSAVDGIVEQRDFFDKDIANKSNLENYYIVEQGDYVYNPRVSKYAPVGPLFKNNTKKTGIMSPLYTIFRFKNKDNNFFQYYFKSNHWFSSIRRISNTGARFDRMSITSSDFMKIPVLSPSIKEQQKIAECLSSLDEIITAEAEKIEQLEKHKKGLMQGLFPVMYEGIS